MLRAVQIALHVLLGIGAFGAGQAFVRDPSGQALGMGVDWLEGSPFPDFLIPGLVLFFVIGNANLYSAWALARRRAEGPLASLGTGVVLVAWVAIQTAIIGYCHPSQLIWFVTFPLVAFLGALLTMRARSEAR